MDLKVRGELLTYHRRGNVVDVDALRDQIPLRQITGKGPQMGSHGNRGSWRQKSIFVALFWYPGNIWEFIGRRVGLGGLPWAHKPGGRALPPWARPCGLWPHGGSPALVSKLGRCLLVQEKLFRRFYSVWTPFNIPNLQYSKTRKKQKLALGTRLIG